MIRELTLKRDKLKTRMQELWDSKEKKPWSKEQRADYDKLNTEQKSLSADIKLRSEFAEDFAANLPKEDKKGRELSSYASPFNILKREIRTAYGENGIKVDSGKLDEALQERERNRSIPLKTGERPFQLETRATISTAASSAQDLVQETIYPGLIKNLYEKTWLSRVGANVIQWRGDFVMPSEDTKPTGAWKAETSEYDEASIDYKAGFTLQPKKLGFLQPFSLQSFIQDQNKQMMNSINSQLMKAWAVIVDTSFLYDDGSGQKPKGLLELTGVQELDTDGANGASLDYGKCLEAEALLLNADQDMAPSWIVNTKTITKARGTLRTNTSGASWLATKNKLADTKTVVTNILKSNLTKGSAAAKLSEAVLVIGSSCYVIHWDDPTISLDRSLGFKSDTIWAKISGYCNFGFARPAVDVVRVKNLLTDL